MKAIITAAGRGTRLYPLSRAIPKELIPFCGIPIIEYGINFLKKNGIIDIIVIVGPKKSPIMDYLGNGKLFGVNIAYVIQEEPNGLGDAISTVGHYVDDNDFIVLLGDTILFGNSDLQDMIRNHKYYNATVTILLEHISENPERYGIVKINEADNRIISLIEKPISKYIQEEYSTNYKGTDGWHSIAGLYIINNNIFNYLKKTVKGTNNEIQLTDAIELSLNNKDVILGHILKGKRIDIGSWQYIAHEREFYMKLDDDDIQKIIRSREEIKER